MSEPTTKKAKVSNGDKPFREASVGRPRYRPGSAEFATAGGISVSRVVSTVDNVEGAVQKLLSELDETRGCIFESAYEYPGRYARWTMGFSKPPLVFETADKKWTLKALNERGLVLLPDFLETFKACKAIDANQLVVKEDSISGSVLKPEEGFSEENRSKQNSVFSVIRDIIAMWKVDTETDPQLGLYGAFGYDLTFQFEPIKLKHTRREGQRDMVVYLPDDILVHDKQLSQTWRLEYDFTGKNGTTKDKARTGEKSKMTQRTGVLENNRSHQPGEYAESVKEAREQFRVGNLFEVVLSQKFREACDSKPSEIFERLRQRNPSPYMFVINLGEDEALVGASPEMFVRVEAQPKGLRVETCPISGTIKRGDNPLEDADRIREILSSLKEESELTMCTDVDRNDKSRVCEPGSVQVIGRRQIEKYSKLIHTVDHVEGYLREGFDALDAFLVHTWAVTVSGCPKAWAIQFIENTEKTCRNWYGGAVGLLGFDGGMNTGMTLRTIRIIEGVAEIQAGATLLYDSVPASEEKETELKASAFREAVLVKSTPKAGFGFSRNEKMEKAGLGKHVLLIDHHDSFVNTLASYFRETGAKVTTMRYGLSQEEIKNINPDLVVLSPGPGKPKDFDCSGTIQKLINLKIPIFGVCLGLQSMVEHFGGELGILNYPLHGKPAEVSAERNTTKWKILEDNIPETFTVARYHSLYAIKDKMPDCLNVTAATIDESKVIMAIEHKTLPIAGVQFHPESIITGPTNGLQLLTNTLKNLSY